MVGRRVTLLLRVFSLVLVRRRALLRMWGRTMLIPCWRVRIGLRGRNVVWRRSWVVVVILVRG